jgi:hypothetical protein
MLTFSVTVTNMWTLCICYYLCVFNACSLHWPDDFYLSCGHWHDIVNGKAIMVTSESCSGSWTWPCLHIAIFLDLITLILTKPFPHLLNMSFKLWIQITALFSLDVQLFRLEFIVSVLHLNQSITLLMLQVWTACSKFTVAVTSLEYLVQIYILAAYYSNYWLFCILSAFALTRLVSWQSITA